MNESKHTPSQRLIIISNRLPIVVEKKEETLKISPGSGGLVTAIAPILRDRGGVWIGWPGPVEANNEEEVRILIQKAKKQSGYTLIPTFLSKEEIANYYAGFSNEILWPLFHDLPGQCNFVPEYWTAYQNVNAKFAETALSAARSGDFIWVHDYHLMLLAHELRQRGIDSSLSFFLHIPFPSLDIFLKLPWRFQLIRALLEFDLIGFQTMRDRRNFIQCVRFLLPDVSIQNTRTLHICKIGNREVKVGAFPISIDFKDFDKAASSKETETKVHEITQTMPEQKIMLCVDRLDYTKGIPYRLEAFRTLLKKYPEFHRKITLVQLIVPSRMEIPKYAELKIQIDKLVGEINSEFTKLNWVPIHYMFRSLTRSELLGYYRASEIALITPIKDGMNLVGKEFIACNRDETGALILSEFAGAASQLYHDALIVNPYDIEGLNNAIYTALTMPRDELRARMRRMRRSVRRYDIFWWMRNFLNVAFGKELVDFPVKEFIPSEEEEMKKLENQIV